MRISCPNCDAQYEVPEEVIPTEGRDVQCSNCGNTWYLYHPDFPPEENQEDLDVLPGSATQTVSDATDVPPAAPEASQRPRRTIDPEVADILKQEAEREQAARAAESGGLESQPELGLPAGETEQDRRAREARDRMARIRGEAEASMAVADADGLPPEDEEDSPQDALEKEAAAAAAEAAATAAAMASRRELLPDIEEINSTLRSTGDREGGTDLPGAAETAPRKRRGFRRGFAFAILAIAVAAAIYIFAPVLAETVPQLDPWLSGYVTWVDAQRISLDVQVQSVLKWLDEMAAASSE